MESLLVCTIILTLLISFFCSLSEAALYSVSLGYVKHLAESNSRTGKVLLGFKEDMSKPIAAILIVNTVANTIGPAIGGALVVKMWGDRALGFFALGMSLAVLSLSEIIPKITAVTYAKKIACAVAWPWAGAVALLRPVLWLFRGIARAIEPEEGKLTVSHEEVLSLAALGAEEGVLDHFEGSVIANIIGLDKLLVRDVLTPRVVVFRQEENTLLSEIEKDIPRWRFTRIPLYSDTDPDHLATYVTQRDIYRRLICGDKQVPLKALARPITTVPELMRVDKLCLQMFEKKEQICAVVDEHGGLAGIITLEDIIEEIVGHEIVDEYDKVADLRKFTSLLKVARTHKPPTETAAE